MQVRSCPRIALNSDTLGASASRRRRKQPSKQKSRFQVGANAWKCLFGFSYLLAALWVYTEIKPNMPNSSPNEDFAITGADDAWVVSAYLESVGIDTSEAKRSNKPKESSAGDFSVSSPIQAAPARALPVLASSSIPKATAVVAVSPAKYAVRPAVAIRSTPTIEVEVLVEPVALPVETIFQAPKALPVNQVRDREELPPTPPRRALPVTPRSELQQARVDESRESKESLSEKGKVLPMIAAAFSNRSQDLFGFHQPNAVIYPPKKALPISK